MEWFCDKPRRAVKAALFDFDGTISTLRRGWETVMGPLMVEWLQPFAAAGEDIDTMVRAYLDESAGIQTIHQMKWLARQVAQRGGVAEDPWAYKAQYNVRLMETVQHRRDAADRRAYLVAGSEALLRCLHAAGVALYIASGTDEKDVRAEAALLGVAGYFRKIAGATEGREDCSKEAVIRELLENEGLDAREIAVVGDGKVEIRIGRDCGARTLGVASDETAGQQPEKRARLLQAGADAIVGDFTEAEALRTFFFGTEVV